MAQRYIEWGNWGIDLRERVGDAWANPGWRVGYIPFAIGARGPIDAGPGVRDRYIAMVKDFIDNGAIPAGMETPIGIQPDPVAAAMVSEAAELLEQHGDYALGDL